MTRLGIHRTIYITLLCVLVISLTTSNYVMNMAWVFLGANWLVECGFRRKFAQFKTNYLLQAFFALMLVHLLWLIGTENLIYGLDDIRKKLPLLCVPLVVLTSEPLNRKEQHWVVLWYIATLTVVSIIGLVRYCTISNLPYREVVPYISHIRFSLNLCLGIVILIYAMVKYHKSPRGRWLVIVSLLLIDLFVSMLVPILQSYTSVIVLVVLSVVLLVVYWKKMGVALRWVSVVELVMLFGGALLVFAVFQQSYYRPCALLQQPRVERTVNGNPYTFADNGLMENGNYIDNYVCESELRSSWPLVSNASIDSVTDNGYAIYYSLVRYLNARGMAKDSAAVVSLTPSDVAAIERGVANPLYEESGFLRRSVYAMLFERDNARLFGNRRNFSMGERWELWCSGWRLFLQHPLFGVGTGDGVDKLHQYLVECDSQLSDTDKHIHNQYLTFLVSFGIVGFGVMVFFFARAWRRRGPSRSVLLTTLITIALVSCISEDTLETLAGCLFVVTFLCLFSQQPSIKCQNTNVK